MGLTCWMSLFCDVVGPQVTLIKLHREQRGSRCLRRYSQRLWVRQLRFRVGLEGRILGNGPWAEHL